MAGPTQPTRFDAPTAEDFLARVYPPKEPLAEGLVHRRDLVAFGARRRNGKTTLLTNLAVALATGAPDFLGYRIPQPRRSLLLMLEDDPGEYQGTVRKLVGDRNPEGRIAILTREDFLEHATRIDAADTAFQGVVRHNCEKHDPDLTVFDNLAHVIGAEYNDSTRVHTLMKFCFELARDFDTAVILAAHPRKEGQEKFSLEEDANHFFESIMGTSHFINSTGSLWGLERKDQEQSIFLGGRQRGEGTHGFSRISRDDDGWFRIMPNGDANFRLAVNTEKRGEAWKALPDHPQPFGYREGEGLVRMALSKASYHAWLSECRRLFLIVDAPDGKLVKAPGLPKERVGLK